MLVQLSQEVHHLSSIEGLNVGVVVSFRSELLVANHSTGINGALGNGGTSDFGD